MSFMDEGRKEKVAHLHRRNMQDTPRKICVVLMGTLTQGLAFHAAFPLPLTPLKVSLTHRYSLDRATRGCFAL